MHAQNSLNGQIALVTGATRGYGFTDIDGTIPDAEKLHAKLKESAPEYWANVLGNE